MLNGAQAHARRIDADVGGTLYIESPQDTVEQESKQSGGGIRAQVALGTAWNVSGNYNQSKASGHSRSVGSQSGLFAGEGGYHITADGVRLKGGAIASAADKDHNELTARSFSFEDIRNESSYSASSMGIGAGYGGSLKGSDGFNQSAFGRASQTAGQNMNKGLNYSPTLPQHESGDSQGYTRSLLSEGNITIDGRQTSARALGIHTDLQNAHRSAEAVPDLQNLLDKQQTIAQSTAAIHSAVGTYRGNRAKAAAEELEKQQLEQVGIRLAQRQEKWNAYRQYQNRFAHIRLPEKYDELQNDDFQIAGLWQDNELNDARSRLFGCALQLHEAWLAEVAITGGGFGSNLFLISEFLKGSAGLNKEQTLSVWQSLFMVIPVVSGTFASFARQFRDVGAGCLGYLFIDEAGQAVPQAAAGAIWRAKRVMAVGDPIQIEPVFTTPPPLVRTLERIAALPDCANVSPTEVSVQILADRCNAFGASVLRKGESDATWIGSPLRVHRRCADPMFGIANQIAYDNKMVFGNTDPAKRLPPKQDFYLGSSSWVQIAGEAASRQFVQEQADLVIRMLAEIVRHSGGLPDLYIITPFKQIKTELCRQIAGNAALKTIKGLQQWCRMRIGTVHTFQGKEEKMVWLVLGCDAKTDGAAQWAAGKPNLLNVALTRAKHYVFVIGDKDLWAGKKYFDVAAKNLPQIDAREFYSRAEQLSDSPAPHNEISAKFP